MDFGYFKRPLSDEGFEAWNHSIGVGLMVAVAVYLLGVVLGVVTL